MTIAALDPDSAPLAGAIVRDAFPDAEGSGGATGGIERRGHGRPVAPAEDRAELRRLLQERRDRLRALRRSDPEAWRDLP